MRFFELSAKTLSLGIIFVAESALASSQPIVCSYPGYAIPGDDSPVPMIMLEISLQAPGIATVKSGVDVKFVETWQVLQNTGIGIVLSRSFAEYNNYTKRNDLGAYVIVIDRSTGAMIRALNGFEGTEPRQGRGVFPAS
ncbi:MAG: hypothetical protein ACK52N_14785 [Lysobacteraceae bacterium]